jgi:acyl-CoA-binding protein
MVDFVNRAKWNAWNDLKSLSKVSKKHKNQSTIFYFLFVNYFKAEAEKKYIELINELVKAEPQPAATQAGNAGDFPSKFQDITASVEYNNVYKIVLNRPNKLNAITVKV